MSIREERQQEAVEAFLNTPDRRSVINACPRFGKIKVAIEIIRQLGSKSIWILMPRKDIIDGWHADFQKFGQFHNSVLYVTFASIKKLDRDVLPKLVIIDEPHELSVNQQVALSKVIHDVPVLGLTGTMTQKTRNELYDNLNLDVCYKYTIDQGVEEGILADYQMFVHQVPLDDTVARYGKSKKYTEKRWFDINQKIKQGAEDFRTKHFMDLKMINIIQNSIGKRHETMKLIHKYRSDRILVFCGVTEVADNLQIPVYHSKAREKQIFLDFCQGKGMHLATIKMMQAGVTIKPIHKGIINYMSGNPEDSAQKICRFLGLEYDNPDKKAEIHIVSSNEDFETERLKTGLAFFDKSKISII